MFHISFYFLFLLKKSLKHHTKNTQIYEITDQQSCITFPFSFILNPTTQRSPKNSTHKNNPRTCPAQTYAIINVKFRITFSVLLFLSHVITITHPNTTDTIACYEVMNVNECISTCTFTYNHIPVH